MKSAEETLPEPLRLEGELTIYRAAELIATIENTMRGAHQCALDLEAVTEIDTSGVQLLLAAQRTARETGRTLILINPSTAVLDAWTVLGVSAATCVPGVADEHKPTAGSATSHAEVAYGS